METKKLAELKWLEWFANNVDFGPAHGDVMIMMQEQYEKETGRPVPEAWKEN